MATQTIELCLISLGVGEVRLEIDYDDTGIVTGVDDDGDPTPIIKDQPLLAVRIVNDIPLKDGSERLVAMSLRPSTGRDKDLILRTEVVRGTTTITKSPGVNKVGDVSWYSLGVVR